METKLRQNCVNNDDRFQLIKETKYIFKYFNVPLSYIYVE